MNYPKSVKVTGSHLGIKGAYVSKIEIIKNSHFHECGGQRWGII